jgi:methylated-DNA-[protein]-cysteine S-methyltransferase
MITATTPQRRRKTTVESNVVVTAFRTELGWMAAEFIADKLVRLTFGHTRQGAALAAVDATKSDQISPAIATVAERLTAFAAGVADDLLTIEVAYYPACTAFQRRVLDACRAIPPGETLSYAQLATIAGAPGAARAVGNVMRTNRLPLVVPCHRVVGSGGGLGGYSAPDGLDMKRRLLAREGAVLR